MLLLLVSGAGSARERSLDLTWNHNEVNHECPRFIRADLGTYTVYTPLVTP